MKFFILLFSLLICSISLAEKSDFDFSNIVKFSTKNRKEKVSVRQIFNDQINEDVTVVKFSADWCTPCKKYAPSFNNVANELKEIQVGDKLVKVKFITIDCDEFPTLSDLCGVNRLPMTIFYKNGKLLNSNIGILSQEDLIKKINLYANK